MYLSVSDFRVCWYFIFCILPVWRKAAVAAVGARTALMASRGRVVDLITVDPWGPPRMMVVNIGDGNSCLDVSPFPIVVVVSSWSVRNCW